MRGELLDDLLTPTPRTYTSLAERAHRIGYQPQKRHAVVVAHIRAENRQSLALGSRPTSRPPATA